MALDHFFTTSQKNRWNQITAIWNHGTLLSKLVRVPTYRETLPQITAELSRARRYQRPLTLVLVDLGEADVQGNGHHLVGHEGNGASNGDSGAYLRNIVSLLLGSILQGSIRETDLLTFDAARNRYVIVMPETTEQRARRATHRLNDLLLSRFSAPMRVGISEFPLKGLTVDEIISSAEASCCSLLTESAAQS